MALETGGRIPAWIHNELAASAASFDVFAARAVTGFTTALAGHGRSFVVNARVRAGRKDSHVIRVTLETRPIADVVRSRDFWWSENSTRNGGTGIDERNQEEREQTEQDSASPMFHRAPPAGGGFSCVKNQRAPLAAMKERKAA